MAALTVHFHPDWPFGDGLVIEAMAAAGRYRSQFETGTSNGGLTAHPGGDRWIWESRLFAGRYDTLPADERPVYGSWNFDDDAYGGSPRFGSAYLQLIPAAAERATYCFPDSYLQPTHVSGPGGRPLLCALADDAELEDPLDRYVEAHVHGGVRFAHDVEALVLDTCHAQGPVRDAAEKLGCPVRIHPGYRVATADLPEDYRGPDPLALAVSLGEEVTPDLVARARRTDRFDPQWIKQVWHLCARFGRQWS